MKRADIVIQKFKDAPIQIIDGDRGKNYPIDSELLDEGFCLFLNTGNVTESGFNFNNCQFISFDKDQILRKGKLKRNDLVMTTRGTVGNVGYYNNKVPFENIRINSGMVIFRVDQEEIIPSFFYQYLRSTYFNKQVNALRTGAAQPQLPIRDIKCIKIQIPQILEQEKIADILSSYDDLIDTNRRRIQLLEDSARLLFREWFVYFRFPGYEKVKIVDGVPEGWEKEPIKKYFDTTSGGTPSREHSEYYQGDINWVKTQELDEKYIFDTEEKITQEAISKSSAKIFPAYTLLVSIYGNANIGRTGILAKPAASNQACVAFFPKKQYCHYIYLQQYLQMIRDYLLCMSQGAAQTNISQDTLRKVNILMPDELLMNKFIEKVEPMYEQIKNLQQQNQKLAQARDLLLPKLMRGEVRI